MLPLVPMVFVLDILAVVVLIGIIPENRVRTRIMIVTVLFLVRFGNVNLVLDSVHWLGLALRRL